ncbi:ATP-binding protein [Allokutzneria sp. A3M-2-11 16]|uniref:ATP-binding protein n=1 Tax=Allokutzneria sp. A3M-2-11 16 TaxID=2962043 RepID=UPI0020B6E8BC|nr:ATP-binding protein [Allokutzneria sp. A3M-2-11 16]MCP3803699.1 ATP-binding protein [Allokutzneria sp. A3M-2-11 16]
MFTWHGFRFHELTELPRPAAEDKRPEAERRADRLAPLLSSLAGSHADLLAAPGAPALVTAWIRPPHFTHLRLLLGGRPHLPAAGPRGQVLFPPGARGSELADRDAAGLFGLIESWVPCAARPDALWSPAPDKRDLLPARRGSFDQHVAHLREPFAWLVIAEPLGPAAVQPELDRLVTEILPLTRGEVGEGKRIMLERKQSRHRELSRAQVGGAWRIRVLAGGAGPRAAGTVAGMLCAAADLGELPYALAPVDRPAPFEVASADRYAFTAGTELLVALTRPPERELPGLRLVEPHTFDVTPERPDADGEGPAIGLTLGTILDESRTGVGNLVLDGRSLNRHTFVCGSTGAGKSQTVRHLLTEAARAGLPWLAVEPAKAEYARMARRLAGIGEEVVVIRPGASGIAPAGFNPLRPAEGFPLQTHADLVRALFLAAFDAQEPFPQILTAALTRCYEELGWDMTLDFAPVHNGRTPRCPTLADLQRVAEAVVDEIGYSKEITDNVRGFIRVRLGSLRLGTTGRFFDGGHPLDFAELLRRNVVLEIEDVGDDSDKGFLMGAVLIQLTEHLRISARRPGTRPGLRHLTVIEEAHRLLRRSEPGTPAAHAVEMFAALLAEVRSYGEGLVIAEQIPGKLTPEVIKNTAVKIVHRLPALDDREAVGATMNLDEAQSRYLVTLAPGDCAVFADRMDRPVLVDVLDGSRLEREGSAEPAPVDGLIARRSRGCGRECLTRACTLGEMRQAQRLITTRPWLSAWAELTVLAHLTGDEVPVPDEHQLRLIRALPARELDCAISHAVDDAVAIRAALLQPEIPPEDFAVHCTTVLRAVLAGQSACAGAEPHFLAAHYVWNDVRKALLDDLTEPGPHPRTAEWERRFHRPLPGSRIQQFDQVSVWWRAALFDEPRRDAVTFGTRRPSALETAIDAERGTPAWESRTNQLLLGFTGADWARDYLMAQANGA